MPEVRPAAAPRRPYAASANPRRCADSGSASRSSAHAIARPTGSSSTRSATGASTNCACPPPRCARIVSICSGAFVLAAAGLLDRREAATHGRYGARLAAGHPRVRVRADALYLDGGDVLTSAATAAGIDLCLHLIRADHGAAVANAVARRMVVAPHTAT